MRYLRLLATAACFASVLLSEAAVTTASLGRVTRDLSRQQWGLWRDFKAEWRYDAIHLPPVDVAELPVNPPSCGWDALASNIERTVTLPATVEEFFWGDNGNIEGVGGDYRGVSWWVTTVDIGHETAGKRLFLDFGSVHLRAEVFVNRRLTGYDVIGHTPFTVDITGAAKPGPNEIAVRITDPAGNFNWNDRTVLKWGSHDIPACHGFGGITGNVTLRAVDDVHIADVAVLNRPEATEADILATLSNLGTAPVRGTVTVAIHPWNRPAETVWKKTLKRTVPPGSTVETIRASVKNAKLWSPDDPNLYVAEVSFVADSGSMTDTDSRRFGFRWFDIGDKNGDRRLFLNGRRVVLLGGMSWGFWPVNGVFPTPEMAEKDIRAAKALGLNYMNFHRAIGQPLLMDAADELGLFTYEEPGGYSCEGTGEQDGDSGLLWRAWRREKLLRMAARDRSHPSLIIYNLQNRTPNPMTDEDVANMKAFREIDPSRIFTFISGFWKEPPKESPDRLFFAPYDPVERYTGWYDMHNHTAEYAYSDRFYNGPKDYLRYTGIDDDVVFWGEDGGLYSPPRLQLIRNWHIEAGHEDGWMTKRFLSWYDAWDDFLGRNGFREAFPDVDALTVSLGNATLRYHGRIVENIRAGNLDDCYTINGWAAPRMSNQSEVADLYRNPCGDPGILARYCRPRYVAVKLRDRVAPAGSILDADIHFIDETGVRGTHTLTVTVKAPSGSSLLERTFPVTIPGDGEYGRLLAEDIEIPLGDEPGYVTVEAVLTGGGGEIVADGSDMAYAVDVSGALPPGGAVIDTTGAVNRFLKASCGASLPTWNGNAYGVRYIVLGGHRAGNAALTAMLDAVAGGATLIVLGNSEPVAAILAAEDTEALDYRGALPIRKGNLVAGRHALLDGLPQRTAFDWEYQAFYTGRGMTRSSLNLYGAETVIAAVTDNERQIGSALAVVPYGRGHVVLSTLNILPLLDDDAPQAAVARRLLFNMLDYAVE